jgi:methionyl-tRNA formyltransferase
MSAPISLWFLGTSEFAVSSLEALSKDPAFRIDLAITQPDRPTGRKQVLTPPPVKLIAEKQGIPVLQPENINDATLPSDRPDFLVIVAFGQILSQKILDIPTVAPVNVHGSLLPRWRGASPIHHAILTGDTETGVTVQKVVKELDAGPILSQKKVAIGPRETFSSLYDTLAPIGAALLCETLKKPLKPVEQDATHVTVCRKLSREDGFVDPATMTADEIDRKARALTPWPGVTMTDVKLLETSLEPTPHSTPLPCAKNSILHLVKVQPAGGKPMSGSDWMRGRQPK